MAVTTTPVNSDLQNVLDAMRDIQTEGDAWKLAEALVARIPDGLKGFDEIIDQATAAGVVGKLKANSLRLYRDAAKRWPAEKRVAGVSFSAHREAMALGENVADQRKLIEDIRKGLKPGETVSVASVRQAVRLKRGIAPTPKNQPTAAAAAAMSNMDILSDLRSGSPKIIAAIKSSFSESDLEKLQDGLNKALAHVEKLRMRSARAKAAAKKATAPAAAAATGDGNGNGNKTQTPAPKRGDLRGL